MLLASDNIAGESIIHHQWRDQWLKFSVAEVLGKNMQELVFNGKSKDFTVRMNSQLCRLLNKVVFSVKQLILNQQIREQILKFAIEKHV